MRAQSIAICGSGIGGLATALALDARGHAVTVFEKVDAPRPVGSGLMLQPTGQAALARLGLLDQALAHGRILDGIRGHTRQGRTIFDVKYGTLGQHIFGLGIHRGTLFQILSDACQHRGITITTGSDITASHMASNQRRIATSTGTHHGAYDLVIDATGLHSPLRAACAEVSLNKPYPYGAVWGVVREPVDWQSRHTLTQRYDTARAMAGILPIGRLPGSDQPLSAFFWSLKTADLAAWRATPFADWQMQVTQLWPAIAPFVQQFQSHADLAPASYSDVWLKAPVADRLAFVGDAARSASPQLGQGANLALLDAVILADSLASAPSVNDALAAYARARHAHTLFYGLASRWLTPFFQSDSRLAGTIRDLAFAPMARIPYLRREMVRTLAGVKTGLLSHQTPNGLAGSVPVEPVTNPQTKPLTAPAAD